MRESRIIRDRQRAQQADLDASEDNESGCNAAMLVTTTTVTAYPAAINSFFACNPTWINGAEIEGGAAAYVVDAATVFYVYNIGSVLPPNGRRTIAEEVGGRLVMDYNG